MIRNINMYSIKYHSIFFLAEIVLVLDQNFMKLILVNECCTKCDYLISNTLIVSVCIQMH